jgi:hypothetical protein
MEQMTNCHSVANGHGPAELLQELGTFADA